MSGRESRSLDWTWLESAIERADAWGAIRERIDPSGMAAPKLLAERVLAFLPPADLPATLATVDDVRRVCIAAGLRDGDLLWSDETCHVTADVGYEWPGSTEALGAVYVERADDTDVSKVHAGALGALLWHAIQAARSAS